MLRRKSGNSLIAELLLRHTQGIPDRKDSRVKHAYNIPGIGLLQYLPLACHNLLRLRETHDLISLHMLYLHAGLVFPGTDSHKGNSVPVSLIHIRLYFKHKCGKIILRRHYQSAVSPPGKRCCGHFKEMLQKKLHAEIGKSRPEKHRRQIPRANQIQIKFRAGSV